MVLLYSRGRTRIPDFRIDRQRRLHRALCPKVRHKCLAMVPWAPNTGIAPDNEVALDAIRVHVLQLGARGVRAQSLVGVVVNGCGRERQVHLAEPGNAARRISHVRFAGHDTPVIENIDVPQPGMLERDNTFSWQVRDPHAEFDRVFWSWAVANSSSTTDLAVRIVGEELFIPFPRLDGFRTRRRGGG